MDIDNHSITQDLVYYAESRLRKIVFAMDKLQKSSGRCPKWFDSCLRQEVVSYNLLYLFYADENFYKSDLS